MKFRIIFNPHKEWAKKLAPEVELFMKRQDHAASENEDIAILIGGDGTIFHSKSSVKGAVFAIGGKQSKVCQANFENWEGKLARALKKFSVDERIALSIKINGKDAGWAVNDAVVHSRKHNFIELKIRMNKDEHEFGGDGVIVATATGATGYAYSAGGFIIGEVQNTIEVVPICPYLRKFRPALVPALFEITIHAKGAADLIIDGQEIIELGETDVVRVIGDRKFRFVKV